MAGHRRRHSVAEGAVLEPCQQTVDVPGHLDAVHRAFDPAVRTDDERRPLDLQWYALVLAGLLRHCPELLGQLELLVYQQREVELMLQRELAV